jgi:hypothetical protein
MTLQVAFETVGWFKVAEQDHYDEGCDPDTTICTGGGQMFQSRSLAGLYKQLTEFVGSSDIQLNACGYSGRVDIQGMEDSEGVPVELTKRLYAQWREGKVCLWLATYTFYVQRVTRENVKLT